jgi:predicted dinucleotide-binding enzyme
MHELPAHRYLARARIAAGAVSLLLMLSGLISSASALGPSRLPPGLKGPPGTANRAAQNPPFRIGIIGTGNVGGTLARLWVKAGNDVMVSSPHPAELLDLVKQLGPHARSGTPMQAAQFGTVVLVSVPYSAMPQIGRDLGPALTGKVIIDTSNPVSPRDGAVAAEARSVGAGIATAQFLHSNRIVRAFNCMGADTLKGASDLKPERLAIPIGGDDAAALRIAEQLVREAGFDPVVVGSLAETRKFDLGQPLAKDDLTAAQLRKRLKQNAQQASKTI